MGYREWLSAAKKLYYTVTGDLLDESEPDWFDWYCDNYTPSEAVEMRGGEPDGAAFV